MSVYETLRYGFFGGVFTTGGGFLAQNEVRRRLRLSPELAYSHALHYALKANMVREVVGDNAHPGQVRAVSTKGGWDWQSSVVPMWTRPTTEVVLSVGGDRARCLAVATLNKRWGEVRMLDFRVMLVDQQEQHKEAMVANKK